MAFKIQITPKKSEQLAKGAKATFVHCKNKNCTSTDFEETGLVLKSIVCAHCGHRFSSEEGAIYKRVESDTAMSHRKTRPGSGARFKKSEFDFGKRK